MGVCGCCGLLSALPLLLSQRPSTHHSPKQTPYHSPKQQKKTKDLELYLTKEEVEGGYTLVARYGRVLQELVVRTKLDRDTMKKALTRVLSRVR